MNIGKRRPRCVAYLPPPALENTECGRPSVAIGEVVKRNNGSHETERRYSIGPLCQKCIDRIKIKIKPTRLFTKPLER